MIITAPLRRMILHRSQRGLTEVRIFIGLSGTLARKTRTTTTAPKAANLLTLPHRRLELLLNFPRHRVDIPRAIDIAQDAPLTVVLDHWHGVLEVDLDAL